METVIAPAMTDAQLASWRGLLAVSTRVPTGWCLVGGQMVQLHCWERGASPNRPTDDSDAVLDVRADPTIVMRYTAALVAEGFSPVTGQRGIQHRWVKDDAVIDILIPAGLGARAAIVTVGGGRPIQTPGAQNVLDRAAPRRVALPDGTAGLVRRPDLQGALLAKAFAYTVVLDRARDRHLIDLAVLASLVSATDRIADRLTTKELHKLGNAVFHALDFDPAMSVDGGPEGLDRLRDVLSRR